ncbi:hypothetical protein COV18_07425 [Candidatus Woesearchaeota archaeon CG10_big_fil_rev_8_21_14_0_10_37_12]|nr:MAG: hypothetical protein COV18_07425 [Candidatus Woesearchaeota archaeon CG10_big_fil_rev_8_21_14_0_10_37_12]
MARLKKGTERKQDSQKRINLDLTASENRVLDLFFACPTQEFTFNDLCKLTKTSKTTAKRIVERLLKLELIKKSIIGKLWRLSANNDTKEFMDLKIAHNLKLVYASGIIKLVSTKHPQARAIVLFGSFRKGDDLSRSDLDIAVEIPGTREIKIESLDEIALGSRKEKTKINIHIFSRNAINLNLFSNIANGIVLRGFLEVRP